MTHRTPADAYRSIILLRAAGLKPKLIADRYGWHVGVMKKEQSK